MSILSTVVYHSYLFIHKNIARMSSLLVESGPALVVGGGEHDLLAGCPDVPVRVEVDEDVVVEVAAEDLLAPVGDPGKVEVQ